MQIIAAIGLPIALMGFFDKSRGVMHSAWQARQPDCDAQAYKDMARCVERCLSVQAALGAHPVGVQPNGRETPEEQNRVWLKADGYTIIVGKPVMDMYPVVAFPRIANLDTTALRAALNIGLTYARQELSEELFARSPWPDGLAESTMQALSLRFLMVTDKGEIRLDGRLTDTPEADDPDWVTLNGRLTLKDEKQRQSLQEAITRATGPEKLASIVAVSTVAGSMRLVVVSPFARPDARMALVLFEHAQTDHFALREHFFRAHGLTPSEGKIAHIVLDGGTLTEAAERANLSIATVRSYMKAVFAKTGTHRQSELTALYYKSILPVGTSIARASGKKPRRSLPPPRQN